MEIPFALVQRATRAIVEIRNHIESFSILLAPALLNLVVMRALHVVLSLSAAALVACNPPPMGHRSFDANGTNLEPPAASAPLAATCATGAQLVLGSGGAVLPNVSIVDIYWGPNAQPSSRQTLDAFFAAVTQSPYLDFLTEYDTPSQRIRRGSFAASYELSAPPMGSDAGASVVTDAMIQQQLTALLDQGAVPAATPSSLYFLFFPPGVTISDTWGSSCQAFYGYHDSFAYQGQNVFYAVIPDLGPGGCKGQYDGLTTDQITTLVCSHELIEAVTDPVPGTGWSSATQGEIGDICSWNAPPAYVGGFAVQREWSNAAGGCVAGPGPVGLAACNNACIDVSSDPANCGGCGQVCAGGSACQDSVCAGGVVGQGAGVTSGADAGVASSVAACLPDGQASLAGNGSDCCSGQFVPSTGRCGAAAAVDAGVAASPACLPDGQASLAGDGSDCCSGQYDPNTNLCGPLACAAGLTDCGTGSCLDLTSDPANCGACGNACTSAQSCVAGTCA